MVSLGGSLVGSPIHCLMCLKKMVDAFGFSEDEVVVAKIFILPS